MNRITQEDLLKLSKVYDEPDEEKIHAKIEQNPDRYKRIPNISSWEAYRDMENFICIVAPEKLQDELKRTIRGR